MTPEEKAAAVAACPHWFHSFDFGDNILAIGGKTAAVLHSEAKHLPDVKGRTVLDVNAWDGWFSFECERRGASRIVALDRFVWSVDLAAHHHYHNECMARGVFPDPPTSPPFWKPDLLPGRAGFDTAKRLLGSKVEPVVGDLATMTDAEIDRLGTYDVVLWLGSLYHMRDPLTALERVRRVTAPGGLAVVETEAMAVAGFEDRPLCEQHGVNNPLNADPTNTWSPNLAALHGLCLTAGFSRVTTVVGPPLVGPPSTGRRAALRRRLGPLRGLVRPAPSGEPFQHYRAWVYAHR